MAVFRVERNTGYTVMSNHHLRNKELSLKAKGLLSQMLSLPEDWDYTLAGLSYINREKIDAIREAVRELERAGDIQRSRERDEKGRLRGTDYIIYEQPPNLDLPTLENPTLGNPTLENPTQEKPTLENPMQLNKDIQKTDLSKKEKSNTDLSSNHSIPILSPNPSPLREETAEPERKGTEAADAYSVYEEIIKDNIEYEHFIKHTNIDRGRLDEIVSLILETVCTKRKTIRIAGDDYPAELVKAKFMKLNSSHIVCWYQLHFFKYQIPFRFRYSEFNLHRSFSAVHTLTLLFRFSRGFGKLPNKQNARAFYGNGYPFPMLATKLYPPYFLHHRKMKIAKVKRKNATNIIRLLRFNPC